MRLITRVWLFLTTFVLLAALPLVVLGQDTTTYTDPTGQLTTEIPGGWTDENTTGYATFSKDGVSIHLMTIATEDVQTGINSVLNTIVPDFSAEPVQVNDIPVPNGIWTQNVYILDDGSIKAAIGQVVEGVTYVMLVQAPDEGALQATSNDVNNVLLSIAIGEQIDLSGTVPHPLDETDLEDLRAYITASLDTFDVPGASVAVVQNGEVIFAEGFGVTDIESQSPVTADTLFMIGSIGKSVTTMMMASLVDDGILDWETPVVDILPGFAVSNPALTPEIRVRDLVNHASGVQRNDVGLLLFKRTPEEIIESIAAIPMNGAPGENFNYSNQMVAAGGYVAAIAAGATYGEDLYDTYNQLVEARVFEPIGMDSTTLSVDEAIANHNHALPHSYDVTRNEQIMLPISFERFSEPIAPAGAPWSTANEMALYALTAMNDGAAPNGTRVVSSENLALTQTPGVNMGGKLYYGMGWVIEEYKGLELIWHNGGTNGFSSDLAFLPEADLGVVVLSNTAGAGAFLNALREYVFEEAYDLEHSADALYTAVQSQKEETIQSMAGGADLATPEPADLEQYLGEYEQGLSIAYDPEGTLVLGTDYGDVPLLPVEGEQGSFLAANGLNLHFTNSGDEITLDIGVFPDITQTITLSKIQ